MEADGLENIEANREYDVGDFYAQGKTFSPSSTPSRARYDGSSSFVEVSNITASGSQMSAFFKVIKEVNKMIAVGKTSPDQWEPYSVPGKVILVNVDTSSAKFSKTPIYITSLHGKSNHWSTTGASSVYEATKPGFRIYIRWDNGIEPLTPEYAK